MVGIYYYFAQSLTASLQIKLQRLFALLIAVVILGATDILEELYRAHANQDLTRSLLLQTYVSNGLFAMQPTRKLLFPRLLLTQFAISVLPIIINAIIIVNHQEVHAAAIRHTILIQMGRPVYLITVTLAMEVVHKCVYRTAASANVVTTTSWRMMAALAYSTIASTTTEAVSTNATVSSVCAPAMKGMTCSQTDYRAFTITATLKTEAASKYAYPTAASVSAS